MKVFISADIEGTAGIADWDEALKERPDYQEFRELMTAEVAAACEGAKAAGAEEILIKDAHQTGRNLIVSKLPDHAGIVRGWGGHPHVMMFGLDKSFDAALFTGYHAKAGVEANPLAHTMNDRISRSSMSRSPRSSPSTPIPRPCPASRQCSCRAIAAYAMTPARSCRKSAR
jgi:D-amino peptidase